MSAYIYKCSSCHKEFDAHKVESEFIYLCPSCGKTEKNKPLEGVLTIEYNYWELRKRLHKEQFLNLPAGKFWLYPDLWPLQMINLPENILNRLALPQDLLLEYDLNGNKIFMLDDTRNPTLSYKDRASSLVALKALELGIKEISAASTGNAGSSLAGICSKLGLKSNIFVSSSIPDAKRIQIQSFGANLFMVDGSYDEAFDICLEVSSKKKWYNRNTAYNPLTIEGKKSAAYDIFISSKGNIPDTIIVPVGDGVIISGIYKGFRELFELGWIYDLPKLIAVQSTASDALVRYLDTGRFEFKSAYTIADSISAGAPRNLYMAAECVNKTGGRVIAVTDTKIIAAQKIIAGKTGILAEPSSAAGLAGLIQMRDNGEITDNEKVLLLITGNGLKDISALHNWNVKPAVRNASQWKRHFGLK
jgi:threonine synthase